MTRGVSPVDLTRGIDSVYVYSDIVQTKLVGDVSVPLLTVIHIGGKHGEMVFKRVLDTSLLRFVKKNSPQ